ncbi:diheme cytochrome c [Rhodovulum euryhalinum]|uniref:Diheme cytochrome c n=1 Tax=Rhodovulum euryhalinum TaxID=35805 RepID=A0A4R2KG27_9RHOB|nr:diheme cytochrome c [Rhodovulum euryhalinum]TCO69386.1 diheme cytochrome c [Rhodovulum euryhalinum]
MIRSLILAFVLAASPALADDDYMPPVTHPATLEECSACHMAYPAGFLPARS